MGNMGMDMGMVACKLTCVCMSDIVYFLFFVSTVYVYGS